MSAAIEREDGLLVCCLCLTPDGDGLKATTFDTAEGAFWHLVAHRNAGHGIDDGELADLEAEARKVTR